MIDLSRRNFLKTSATAAGLCALGPSAVVQALSVPRQEHPLGRLMPFPLSSVRLTPGIFQEQEEIDARYLDSLAVDRLLHSFRITAGIPSRSTPYKGWEDPTCELRGHFSGGHFLSALRLLRPVREIPTSRAAAISLSAVSTPARRKSGPAT